MIYYSISEIKAGGSALETISGANNWKLVFRRGAEGITLLQAHTCDRRAALPAELFGLPVTALAHHALTPGRPEPEGEQVCITCGPSTGAWDNRALEELHLPDTLVQAGDYAFFNCTGLRYLHLSDCLRLWGGGTLMNCRSLNTFEIRCGGREGEVLSYLADELSRELDVTLRWPDKGMARLLFPEYTEEYEENVPHHQFDFRIQGAGYPYHHCFYQRKFQLRDYDDLWKPYLGMGHDPHCAMRLAWWRLRYPVDLTEKAQGLYLAYLRQHGEAAARWLLSEGDAAGLRRLLRWTEPERVVLAELCARAREMEAPEALAALLEEQHRRFPSGAEKTFDL